MIEKLLSQISNLAFGNPQAGQFLLIGAGIGLFFLAFSSIIKKADQRSIFLLLIRVLSILLLLAAWCDPYLPLPGKGNRNYIVVDLSESMNSGQGQALIEQAKALQLATPTVIEFADQARFENSLPGDFSAWRSSINISDRAASNIERAILEAEKDQVDSKQIVLISDGNENKGSVLDALIRVSPSTKIYPLIPDQADSSSEEFRISLVTAAQIVAAGSKAEIEVSTANLTDRQQSGKLTLLVNGEEVKSETIQIAAKETRLLQMETDKIIEGVNEIMLLLTPQDTSLAKSEVTVFISGRLREKILLVSGSQEDLRYLDQVLTQQSYVVENILAAQISVDSFKDLSSYSAVIFNNIPLSAIPQSAPTTIKKYVEAGGGFLMLGGNNSFGLGGYLGSSIEDILPVKLVPPQKEKKRVNVAVQLVLDQSGSMKESSRIEHAKAAAQAVINGLKPDDYVGIIGFSSTPFELFPMTQIATGRERAMQRIQLMFPGTTTNLMPALDLGRRRLEQARAGRKHMIILTDGRLPDGIARRPYYLQTADQMRRSGTTLSTFLIGNEYDILLKDIADAGGGAFYRTNSLTNLPRLFLEDIKISTGEKTQKEGARFDVRPGDSGILSTEIKNFPNILGYVETEAKPEAQLELTAYANRRAEPLLASWKFGSGRSVAYTSDVSGRWSHFWISWPQFYKFWSNILDSVMNRDSQTETPRFEFNTFVQGNAINIETTVFAELNPADLKLELEGPDGKLEAIALNPVASGHYQSKQADPVAGAYTLQLHAKGTKLTPVKFNIDPSALGERKGLGFNYELLAELASKTGGKLNPSGADLMVLDERPPQKDPIDYFFIIAALFLLLIEIACREFRILRGVRI